MAGRGSLFLVLLCSIVLIPGRMVHQIQPQQKAIRVHAHITLASADRRTLFLTNYLHEKNSPLAHSAADFIAVADQYDLDWTLLPAIAGLESSYGRRIPINSYNPFGWGYSHGGYTHFPTWKRAIEAVATGLRTRYIPEGNVSPYVIGPSYAESPTWAPRVSAIQQTIARAYSVQ